ncbi:aminotransferase class V-fold PLP-dependent enzyme [Vibrio vulnificus]|uniref:DegT/DnrJ/EryC1/StrS family aminotransferase n=1 Tax=Vibrio vulnificus TaxID=672 RepID=UPI0007EE356C|nr:aminotransferase class V-fold PLP-dependent enzyme [Vibrio vulnificus]ANN27788.1 UDP-4-amino-4-deoxy-L-arabinose--oxoglutarate aminotransferase [Vibrio vulnificus]MCU8408566.1 aminotransferase class V-fold PLP-dependent enzyme [Vibrio vulnificus]
MIPLFKPFMPQGIEEEVGKVLYSGSLSYGANAIKFESELRKFIGNEFTLSLSGNSIHFALKLLDIKDGDEVIVSPMCCLMTSQPVSYCGAKVVWCDIDPLTGTLSPEDLRNKITKKTKAIIHYHWSGNIGYIDEINAIARELNIFVIEDASESFGAKYKGNCIGNTGSDITCYSFTPVRLPNAINSSGISFSKKEIFERALLQRDLGIERAKFRDAISEIDPNCDINVIGDSCLIDDLTGLIGLNQMAHIQSLLDSQRKTANIWSKFSSTTQGVTSLTPRGEVLQSYWTYTLLANNRDELLNRLRSNGIYASKLHMRNDHYSLFGRFDSRLLGVNKFADMQLCVPCGWWVDDSELENCIASV